MFVATEISAMTRQSKRRAFLRTAVVAAAAGVAGCADDGAGDGTDEGEDGDGDESPTSTTAETDTEPEPTEQTEAAETEQEPDGPAEVESPKQAVDDWLSNTNNYDGSLDDQTGETDLTIAVGADDGSGGNFAFDSPAVRVTTDTQIQWIWEDASNEHNVRERNGLFDSGAPKASSGKTYSVTLTEPGVYLYRCTNHAGALGMRGAVVVEEKQSFSGSPKVDEWLSEYDEYTGRLTDKTGRSSVSVGVGAGHDGQNRSFSPVAIEVDPGTEIVFQWNGRGGTHDVYWEDGDFEPSRTTRDASNTYSVTIDEPGVYRYFCRTDRPYNGRGAVVVR
jgi:halocyanin-like protein